MKKVLIDHQNFCFRVVDMDDIEKTDFDVAGNLKKGTIEVDDL